MRDQQRSPTPIPSLRRALYSKLVTPERLLLDALNSALNSHSRVLDVGCGAETRILKRLQGQRVGIDLTKHFAPAPGTQVVRADAARLPFSSATFDVVYATSVLEHLPTPEPVFAEIRRVLRPDGLCVLLTPNRWDYISMAASIIPNRWHGKIVERLTGRPPSHTFPTFYRANTPGALRRLADDARLTVVSLGSHRQHPHYMKSHWLLYLVGTVIEQLVQRPFPALRPWLLVTLRAPR